MSTIQGERKSSAPAPGGEGPRGLGVVAGIRSRIADFAQETKGEVAVMFGLMALAMFMMIGTAVDIGRWLNARDQTVAAADSAVLAGGRAMQTGATETQALMVAQKYYNAAVQNRLSVVSDTITFVLADNGQSVKTWGNATIRTPFMGLANVGTLQLLRSNGDDYSKATFATGKNAEDNLEISMMLDVSGSMGGQKITDMKAAASDLVNIVVWADQSKYTSKLAVVPFSAAVRPPASLFAAATNPAAPHDKTVGGEDYTLTPCVAERGGVNKYTGAAPGVGSYVTAVYTDSGNCVPGTAGEVMPMTSNKANLLAKINGLIVGGGTGGHIGTAWAYYMLSPQWASVLSPISAISVPVAYGTPKTKKIAVLMTDGEYNYTYNAAGLATGSPGSSINGTSSASQAVQTCTDMKANNIEVYTIGFDLGGNATAINTLSNCATDAAHFYNAADGEALRQAFRDIALKLIALHIVK